MFIDVNLLPKKEPKNMVFLVGIIIVFVATIAAGTVFYLSVQKANRQIESLTQELKQMRALEAAEQQKLENVQSVQEVQELKKDGRMGETISAENSIASSRAGEAFAGARIFHELFLYRRWNGKYNSAV